MRKQLDVNFGDERIRNCGIGNTIKNKEGNDGNRDRDIYREGKRDIGMEKEGEYIFLINNTFLSCNKFHFNSNTEH